MVKLIIGNCFWRILSDENKAGLKKKYDVILVERYCGCGKCLEKQRLKIEEERRLKNEQSVL